MYYPYKITWHCRDRERQLIEWGNSPLQRQCNGGMGWGMVYIFLTNVIVILTVWNVIVILVKVKDPTLFCHIDQWTHLFHYFHPHDHVFCTCIQLGLSHPMFWMYTILLSWVLQWGIIWFSGGIPHPPCLSQTLHCEVESEDQDSGQLISWCQLCHRLIMTTLSANNILPVVVLTVVKNRDPGITKYLAAM